MTELPILPALVEGVITHQRPAPLRHAFRHRGYQWLVDLDALPTLPAYLRPLASFRSADHLGDPRVSIKNNVLAFLAAHNIDLGAQPQVLMLANARVLGSVFNPLSLFWCYDGNHQLACVVAEVHNTYGERHAYLLQPDEFGSARTPKELYVSPFFAVEGRYEMRFRLTQRTVSCAVSLWRGDERQFAATFQGRPRPATRGGLLSVLVRHPLMPQRVAALIRLHGIWLWLRRLPVQPRPAWTRQAGV